MTVMVLAISSVPDHDRVHHEKITHLPAVVGRSPACDVIIADHYFGARQYILRASLAENSPWEICALENVNPTYLNDQTLVADQWVPVSSGDTIKAGETSLVVYATEHVVDTAQPLLQDVGAWAAVGRMPVAALLFALALTTTAGWSYLEIWSREAAMAAAMSVAAVFFIIIVWAALWSVVSRLLTHRSRFAAQLSLASVYVMVSLICGMVLRGVEFLLSGGLLSQVLTLLTQSALLAILTAACLAAATTLTRRKRIQAALSFAGGLMISLISLAAIGSMGFNPVPPFAATLSPGLARFAPAVSAQDFIADSAGLFDDAHFAEALKKEVSP